MTRPVLLDLYACQGGASKGYTDAGFDVTGVDRDPQPRYVHPERFVLADALEYASRYGHLYDAISASPPCQFYSATYRLNEGQHDDLIGLTRDVLVAVGVPYVIENVWEARHALKDPVMLCGEMFGLKTYRHRVFESSVALNVPPDPPHPKDTVKMGRPLKPGDYYHAVGHFSGVPYVRADMRVPWMNRDGIAECIPPVYSEYVGRQLLAAL